MPPRIASSAFRCPHCRTFTTTSRQAQLGPEHPSYIAIPTPPQQNLPYHPFIKGRLPVPRDVFAGAEGRDKASDDFLDPATKAPSRATHAKPGSREEWKGKMSEMRRRNLREGLVSLKARKGRVEEGRRVRTERNAKERQEAVMKPERPDDLLTTPSHGLDLAAPTSAFEGPGIRLDPSRSIRLATSRETHSATTALARSTRATHLNTLLSHARTFIVTPAQLDAAVEEAFGSEARPTVFKSNLGAADERAVSVWEAGLPDRVQDLLNREMGVGGRTAMEVAGGNVGRAEERVGRLVEVVTGGKGAGGES
ncbi:hypothetical protein LTR86_007904 [Recurvomyces mirabilis]|nr:hypothetical protein LTR86_007904 [Recurvomyces mirabilis]